jgi:hypothetical protein
VITSRTMAAFTTNTSFGICSQTIYTCQPGSGRISARSMTFKTAVIIFFNISRMVVYPAQIFATIKINLVMSNSFITKRTAGRAN